ncbi:hypothetical protein OSB04_000644 [Centaurea solstitialis]|uniref:RRM domain-containing protein n=1 Tax=Centaurea solstitialis TaxID=347529 RepID=A0AA38TWZ1_9ASTR|nr:hypothetical protein OSB04_000644 [Centaurea solstitialis]
MKYGEFLISWYYYADVYFHPPGSFLVCLRQSFRRPKNLPWQRDLLEESLKAAGLPGLDNGAKLYVSNLDIGVTNEDIRELFSEIGELRRYAIHYDKSGRPNVSNPVSNSLYILNGVVVEDVVEGGRRQLKSLLMNLTRNWRTTMPCRLDLWKY